VGQQQNAAGLQVRATRSKLAARGISRHGVELDQQRLQPVEVLGRAPVDDIEIAGDDGRPV